MAPGPGLRARTRSFAGLCGSLQRRWGGRKVQTGAERGPRDPGLVSLWAPPRGCFSFLTAWRLGSTSRGKSRSCRRPQAQPHGWHRPFHCTLRADVSQASPGPWERGPHRRVLGAGVVGTQLWRLASTPRGRGILPGLLSPRLTIDSSSSTCGSEDGDSSLPRALS